MTKQPVAEDLNHIVNRSSGQMHEMSDPEIKLKPKKA
jgi:hypothetical protein